MQTCKFFVTASYDHTSERLIRLGCQHSALYLNLSQSIESRTDYWAGKVWRLLETLLNACAGIRSHDLSILFFKFEFFYNFLTVASAV